MGGSTRITLSCDGPKCQDKIEWIGENPNSVPDSIHRWWTVVLSNKQEFIFCSKVCGLDWLRVNETKVKSPKEREEEQLALEKASLAAKVAGEAARVLENPESEQPGERKVIPFPAKVNND